MKNINFNEIIVPSYILDSVPNQEKLIKKREQFKKGRISPIFVDTKNNLTDGYITWLLYKESNYDGIITVKEMLYEQDYDKCRYKTFHNQKQKYNYKNSPTLYVWGKHRNVDKEYVWRVSNNLVDYLDIEEGDIIRVKTQKGIKYATVTRYEVLNKSPYEGTIRKVIKLIKKGDKE